ncbi:hypothetical protein FHX09_005281 [Rhizobium sp. BK538]|nr:hypothetical protein [Rhizobium sp. BK538]
MTQCLLQSRDLKRKLRLTKLQPPRRTVDAALVGDLEKSLHGGDLDRQARRLVCPNPFRQILRRLHNRQEFFADVVAGKQRRKLAGTALGQFERKLGLKAADCCRNRRYRE